MRRRSNGEGSYRIDKKKKLYEYYERYIDNEGVVKRKHIRAKSREELDKKVECWKKQLEEGTLEEDKRITVSEWSDRYLDIIKLSVDGWHSFGRRFASGWHRGCGYCIEDSDSTGKRSGEYGLVGL